MSGHMPAANAEKQLANKRLAARLTDDSTPAALAVASPGFLVYWVPFSHQHRANRKTNENRVLI